MAPSSLSQYFFFDFRYTIDLLTCIFEILEMTPYKANDPPCGLELLSKSGRHEARLIRLIYTANAAFARSAGARLSENCRLCLRDLCGKPYYLLLSTIKKPNLINKSAFAASLAVASNQ